MRVAFVTNLLTPYRAYLFDYMERVFRINQDVFKVFAMCQSKSDRPWKYEQFKRDYTEALPSRQIRVKNYYLFFNKLSPINHFNPDIIVCAGSYFLPTVVHLLLTKKKYNRRVYLWSESHDKEQKNHGRLFIKLRNGIKQFTLSKFDGFLYASELAKQFVEKYAVPSAHYIYFPNTVDQEAFSQAHLNLTDNHESIIKRYDVADKFVFFTPARLSKEKGLLEFLDILNGSKSKSKVIWLIAGSGELKSVIYSRAQEYDLNVQLLGQCNQDQVIELLSIADCFLLPSFSDPNPLSVIEALWAGKPIFISDGVGNQKEAVIEGVNGFIFNYDNTVSAIDMLDKVINSSREWLDNASAVSYSIAESTYDIKKVVSNFTQKLH